MSTFSVSDCLFEKHSFQIQIKPQRLRNSRLNQRTNFNGSCLISETKKSSNKSQTFTTTTTFIALIHDIT